MPYDLHLADVMRKALEPRYDVETKKMFGGMCWMLHGNMLCGTDSGRFLFRVGKEREATALKWPGASRMEFPGRRVSGFVWVDAEKALDYGLSRLIDVAADYVSSLPPK